MGIWIIAGIISMILIKLSYVPRLPMIVCIVMGSALGFFATLSYICLMAVKRID